MRMTNDKRNIPLDDGVYCMNGYMPSTSLTPGSDALFEMPESYVDDGPGPGGVV
jgi:hypothetical protein